MKPKPSAVVRIARRERGSPKLKVDRIADLAAAISGKDKYAEVLRFSDDAVIGHVRGVVSTRSIAVDVATGMGGFPRGRIVEVFGPEASGKTTLLLQFIAQLQADSGIAAAFDTEEKIDFPYAKIIGVQADKLLSVQPPRKTVESGIETVRRSLDHWITNKLQDTTLGCVWDSVAGTPTEEELENPQTKQPGVAAREYRRAMRQLTGKLARSAAILAFSNQQYEKIGVFSPVPGVKRSTYGGGGLRYHASVRVEMVITGRLKDAYDRACGIVGIAKVLKSSSGPPRDEEFAIVWGRGFSNEWSLFQKLKDHRYITTAGGKYTLSAQGVPPVTWQGGWQGFSDLLGTYADLRAFATTLYLGLPPGVK